MPPRKIPFRPAGAPAEAATPPIVPVSYSPIMCARPCVCKQNRNDMAVSEAAPVSGVRVMGCVRGRGRGEQARRAAGSAAVRSGINFVSFGEGVAVWCCGQDWCDSRCDMRVTGTTGTNRPRLNIVNMPKGWVFFRHTALLFLAIHQVWLRQSALSDEKIPGRCTNCYGSNKA